jgi:hypothetical protein
LVVWFTDGYAILPFDYSHSEKKKIYVWDHNRFSRRQLGSQPLLSD